MSRVLGMFAVAVVAVTVLATPTAAAEAETPGMIACRHESLAGHPACATERTAEPGGRLIGGAANRVTSLLSGWAADGAVWLLSGIADGLGRAGTPQIHARYFVDHYERMGGVAMLLMVPLLCLTLARAAVRADAALAARAVFLYTPLALAGMLGAIAVLLLLLGVVDWATAAVVGDISESTRRFVEGLSRRLLEAGAVSAAGIGAFLFAVASAILSLILWVELVIRARAIEVAVLFLPLGFAALVWPGTSRWCSRLLRTLAALILAQPVIVAVIVLGAGALGVEDPAPAGDTVAASADAGATGGGLIAGISMLAFGCLAPWGLWHLLSPIDGATDAAVEGITRRPTAAVSPGNVQRSAGQLALQALQRGRGRGPVGAAGRAPSSGGGSVAPAGGTATTGGASRAASASATRSAGGATAGAAETSSSASSTSDRSEARRPADATGAASSGAPRPNEAGPSASSGPERQPSPRPDSGTGAAETPRRAASADAPPLVSPDAPVVPRIRPAGPDANRQRRFATPRQQAAGGLRPAWMRRPRPNRPPRRRLR